MRLYNSLSRKIQEFKPLDGKRVRMYHCGPTVYNYAHIGNMRAYVFADTIRRAFEYLGYETKQIINITDVGHLTGDQDGGEDKIEKEAKKEKKKASDIAEFYTSAFFEDLKKLNINTEGTIFPKASKHIKEQIALIEILEQRGLTYITSDGVYFDTSRFSEYGKLGQIDLSQLEEGARVARNREKKNPTDFALWKFSRPEDKRQQEWSSPWGVGFPGWHIECSAMAMKYLGETFDIHTGGVEHIPVHHNNEIAQSECATSKPFARFWLHGEFVNIEGAKMSKSKDNFFRVATLEEHKIHPLAYRYWLLTAHYRTPVTFSFAAVGAAQTAFESIIRKIAGRTAGIHTSREANSVQASKRTAEVRNNLKMLIEDNLNTPGCIALLNEVVHEIVAGKIDPKIIDDFDNILGLNIKSLAHYITEVPEKIKNLSTERETFRLSNNWEKSDHIRREIENAGYYIEDSAAGAKIYRPLGKLSEII